MMSSDEGNERVVVMVTGGTGMVGHALHTLIQEDQQKRTQGEKWIFISSKDADLTSLKETQAVFDKHRPTHVIHLAAKIGGLLYNMNNNFDILRTNLDINSNVYEVSHKMGVKKMVSILSTCIFPENTTYPIDETMLHNGPPCASLVGHSTAKRMMDVMNHLYHEQYNTMFTSVIGTNIYGPHDNFSLQDGHVLTSLIHKIYLAKRDGTPLVVWGSGKARRQFVYSLDVARLLLWALREYDQVSPVILCGGEEEEISIEEVVEVLVDVAEFKGEVIFDTSKSDGQLRKTASSAKLRSYLPHFKFTPIRQGIRETMQWLEDNYDTPAAVRK